MNPACYNRTGAVSPRNMYGSSVAKAVGEQSFRLQPFWRGWPLIQKMWPTALAWFQWYSIAREWGVYPFETTRLRKLGETGYRSEFRWHSHWSAALCSCNSFDMVQRDRGRPQFMPGDPRQPRPAIFCSVTHEAHSLEAIIMVFYWLREHLHEIASRLHVQ